MHSCSFEGCQPCQPVLYGSLLSCAATFNALLEICARTKDSERGCEVIERMQRAGVLPDELTFEAVKNRKALRAHLKRVYDL